MNTLFDPDARTSDPVQSHITAASIVKDGSLKALILDAVSGRWYKFHPVTDDEVWERIEAYTGRRFQRNVIAKARIRMMREGLLMQVPDRILPDGTHRIQYTTPPTQGA